MMPVHPNNNPEQSINIMSLNNELTVSIRPLMINDADISFKWRNDPVVWKYTGKKPSKKSTAVDERNWLIKELQDKSKRRFAICVGPQKHYIGNIQLTDITATEAQYHIFIGDKQYWGQGIGYKASILLIDYARNILKLSKLFLFVREDHSRAINLYKRLGFKLEATLKDCYYLTL